MPDDGERDRVVERQLFMRSLNMGGSMGTYSKQLADRMRDRSFPAGAVIYRSGDASSHLYWVMRGDVDLTGDGHEPMRLAPPSIVGVIDVMQDRPHGRTATAATAVDALVLSTVDYLDILEDNFEIASGVVRGVAIGLHALSLSVASTDDVGDLVDVGAPGSAPPGALVAVTPVPARPLNLVERAFALRRTLLFRAAGVQAVTRLAGLSEELWFAEGEVICRRGEPSPALQAVARGLVLETRDEPRIETRSGAGVLLGGYSSLSHDAHEFDAVALAPTSVLSIAKDDLFDLLEDHFAVMHSMIGSLAAERERLLALRAARAKQGIAVLPIPTIRRSAGAVR